MRDVSPVAEGLAFLFAEGSDGPSYSDEQLARTLPWVVLSLIADLDTPEALPQSLADLLAAFFDRVGVQPEQPLEDQEALLESYADRHPPDGDLLRALVQVMRDATAEGGAASTAMQELIGAPRVRGVLERTAPPQEGAFAGGALAVLGAQQWTKDED
jgi:hypothetical protein